MRSSPGVSTFILFYITVAEVPAIFTDADTRIKEVQIGDHEIKQQIFPKTPPFFLRGINCLTRMQVILRLYEVSISKINFSKKTKPYWLDHIKKIDKNRTNGNFPLRCLRYILVILSMITLIGTK